MKIGRILRILFLGITIGTAWPCFVHMDTYQVPRGERLWGFYLDPDGSIHSEGALESEFFRFAGAAFFTFMLFAVHWSRKRPTALPDPSPAGAVAV